MATSSEKEYILLADESVKDGEYFSNFYGGLIIGASPHDRVSARLSRSKTELGLTGEVKWSKVTEQYLDRYKKFMDAFFDEVEAGRLKVRIMFTANADVPPKAVRENTEGYFKLYYQFIKHAFGLRFIPPRPGGTRLRLLFDEFPETRERAAHFKGFLMGLGSLPEFREARLRLKFEDIAEVRSHDHVLLQALDVVLGSMAFRLNDRHKELVPGTRRRGKRTKAKEQLYKLIVARVKRLRPAFNFGASTGREGEHGTWHPPYRHWRFKPLGAERDETRTKKYRI